MGDIEMLRQQRGHQAFDCRFSILARALFDDSLLRSNAPSLKAHVV